ncbi:UbiA family prenyltransferase [Halodurantibacterium flavum]|uniref:UbiA family prenyltransferase n=1 Tax=Halodurantibacterium flavum TaxID=1382802 RepID=A0ABW4S1V9_9RHOB
MKLGNLWIYQKERFPLARTVPLLAVFSAASISVSAQLAGRPLPSGWGFLAAFVTALLIFFQMRVCDEFKDLDADRRFRPDRPIPRGLISLRAVMGLGVLSLPLTALAAGAWHPPLLWLLGVVWVWLALMTAEFGVPAWLGARPVLYLVSHMAIMPLIDLLLTAFEWMPGGGPAAALALFLALSFVNGCVLEIGRKIWAPQSEIAGVESYSALWGPGRAAWVWAVFVALSFGILMALAVLTDAVAVALPAGGAGAVACAVAAWRHARAPTIATEKRLDLLAGLWVFLCYALAGFAPILTGMF